MRSTLKTWLVASCLALAPLQAAAAWMTDLWYNPNEAGWGANVIDQTNTLFVTLFVYGADGRPAWYVASNVPLISSSTSSRTYSGALYTTTGGWFGGAFNPLGVGVRQVGTLTFVANSPYTATLSYSVDGVNVSKSVQRQTYKHLNLSGTYYGAMDYLNVSSCTITGTAADPFFSSQSISATVNTAGSGGGISITFIDTSGTSTFSGTYTQYGSLMYMSGTFTFPQGTAVTAIVNDFAIDDDGIRGNLILQGATCSINARFAAVKPG